jgi:tetratricopeptide (TPR) repeat protein
MSYKRMGEIHLKLGQSDQAQECLERAGEIFIDKYMDEEAEKVLLEALKLNPSTMNVFNSLGIIYRRQGKYQEAIRSYRKALRVNPEDEHIHYNLARVYMGVNNVTEARKSLIRAKELNPDFQAAQDLLRSIDMGRGLD